MDISGLGAATGAMSAGRLQFEVGTAVLDKALDASANAALSLIAGLAEAIPAGLTYSPAGLSAGSTSRLIASL